MMHGGLVQAGQAIQTQRRFIPAAVMHRLEVVQNVPLRQHRHGLTEGERLNRWVHV